MNRSKWLIVLGLLGTAIAVGQVPLNRTNTNPAGLLPENAVLFVQMDGSLEHQAAFEQTACYEALYESGLMGVFERLMEQLSGAAPPQAQQVQVALQVIKERGLSLAVAVEPPNQGPPQPWGVIVLHRGAELKKHLDELAKRAPGEYKFESAEYRDRQITHGVIPDSPAQVGWWAEQGHLLVAVGINAIDPALDVADKQRGNIMSSGNFAKYVAAETEFEVTQRGWLDLVPLREMFGGMPAPVPAARRGEEVTVLDVLKTLGLDNLNTIAMRTGYKGRSLWSEQYLDAPGEKKGLLALCEQEPISFDQLPPMPASQSGFVASSFNWSKAYDALLQVALEGSEYGPRDGRDDVVNGLQEVTRELGIDLKDDLFDALGHIHCFYADGMQGSLGLSSAAAVSVKDEAALRQSLGTVLGRIEDKSRGQVVLGSVERNGRSFLTVNIPKFPVFQPTISVNDGWLVVGLNSQAVESFYLRLDERLPRWQPGPAYQQALAELPQNFTGLTAMDPSDSYRMVI
ncbi:MAG: hypothetical protein KDA58_02100, partial [Planctomycetaceae bacterium]|nr:hypothetical protein [Planctomycetaceae bacterium]